MKLSLTEIKAWLSDVHKNPNHRIIESTQITLVQPVTLTPFFLQKKIGDNPAPGVNIATLIVPSGQTWLIKLVSIGFTASSTSANRTISLEIYNEEGADMGLVSFIYQYITANQVVQNIWFHSAGLNWNAQAISTGVLYRYGPLPPDIKLKGGWSLRVTVDSIQVTDDLASLSALVEEY